MPDTLKLIFTPWGITDYGDDVWLFENAMVFCVESYFDSISAPRPTEYANLYGQLQGEKSRTSAVAEYTESDLRSLAARAPQDTDAIIDGRMTVQRDPDTDALVEIQVAPRILLIHPGRIEAPDAFVFRAFEPHHQARSELRVADMESFFDMSAAVAESIVNALGIRPSGPRNSSRLHFTPSWDAFCAFIKARSLAGNPEEKRGYYRQALRHDPHFFWALFNDGQLLKSRRDFVGARKRFMEAVKTANDDPALLGDTYFEIGLCSVSLGDPKTARNFWNQALHYAPDNPTLLINIAGTFEQESDFERALEINRHVLEIDPNSHKAIVNAGRLEAMIGNMSAAIGYYSRAIEISPDDAMRQAILGGCFVAVGDAASARKHLEIASRLDPPRGRLAPVTGSDSPDELPIPGDYARHELGKLGDRDRGKPR